MEEQFLSIIAENIKSLRQKRGMSLEKTAKITGVSKSMIAQIERCDVNPTVTILWKIADGFEVSIVDLLYKPKPEIILVRKDETNPFTLDNNKIRISQVLSFDTERRFEKQIIDLAATGESGVQNLPAGSNGFITVFKGNVNITINDETYKLSSGDMISFKSDTEYSYSNPGKKSCRLSLLIHFPR